MGVLGVPTQLAIATIESSAKAQAARRKLCRAPRRALCPAPCPAMVHIANSAIAKAAKIQSQAGGAGNFGDDVGAELNVAALVAIVAVEVMVPFAGGVIGFSEKAMVESPGKETPLRVTGEEKPATEVTVITVITEPCVPTVAEVGNAEIV